MPKLRTYNQIKDSLSVPTYIKVYMNRPLHSYISRLLCGILPLKIETGRYRNIPVAERLCQNCDALEVEDEFHFLFKCENYKDERETLWRDCPVNANSDTERLKYLMLYHCKKLALFIQKCFIKRSI